MSKRRAGPVFARIASQIDDDGDVFVALTGMPPDVLVHADRSDPVEPVRVIDQDTFVFGEDSIVRGVPGNVQSLGDPCDRKVLEDDCFQRPLDTATGDLRPRRSDLLGDLPPHVPAAAASVSADRDQQCGWPPPHSKSPPRTCIVGFERGHGSLF